MKYLLTIVILVLAFSVLTLVYLWPSRKSPATNIVLSVNGHTFTSDFFNDLDKKNRLFNNSRQDQLNSVITRELLIQEAQRLGIDREPSFRAALKNYYEQSLIKVLTDRQYASIQVKVSEQDIDNYLSCFGKEYTFTTIPASGDKNATPKQHTVLFDDLAASLRVLFASMRPGEVRQRFDTGSMVGKIRLDAVKPASAGHHLKKAADRERIRNLLVQQKKAQRMNVWMNSLRTKASIIVYGKKADRNEQETSEKKLLY